MSLLGSALWLGLIRLKIDTRTSLARLGIVVLSVFPTQSSLLALRIPSMSKYSAWFLQQVYIMWISCYFGYAIGIEVVLR